MLAVSKISNTAEAVSFDDALEAFTFGGADDVDEFAFLEDADGQDFTIFFLVSFFETRELSEVAFRGGACFGEMTFHRLGGVRLFFFAESELDSFVSVFFDSFDLCYNTRTSFNHSARYLFTVGIKKTGHSDFFS